MTKRREDFERESGRVKRNVSEYGRELDIPAVKFLKVFTASITKDSPDIACIGVGTKRDCELVFLMDEAAEVDELIEALIVARNSCWPGK